ncbi:hypothetical protein M758_11G112600 [Ceratodon purpureus]|nr:hypothetical protein M758_11G112600 [Ceratodon purpureus]
MMKGLELENIEFGYYDPGESKPVTSRLESITQLNSFLLLSSEMSTRSAVFLSYSSIQSWMLESANGYRVSPRVVEFYKALARKRAHSVPQLQSRDLVLNFSEEEIVEPVKKYMRSTIKKPFEKNPEKVF